MAKRFVSITLAILFFLAEQGVFAPAFGLGSETSDSSKSSFVTQRAVVIKLQGESVSNISGMEVEMRTQYLVIKILGGEFKGRVFEVDYALNSFFSKKYTSPVLNTGDRVIVGIQIDESGSPIKVDITDFERDRTLIYLFLLFAGVLIIVGRMKGVKAIISLLLTAILLLYYMIPMILKGHSPILLSVQVCIFVISISLVIISGFNKKTLAAAIGTVFGIIVAGLIAVVMGELMKISGIYDDEARRLMFIPGEVILNFKGILFAGIIIATMGATMDIGIAVSSSIKEIKDSSPKIGFKALYTSGMNVGRDAMATMANTLILAYVGSSINLILIFHAYGVESINVMNWEMIAVEIMRALCASTGMVLAIPITSFIAAYLMSIKGVKEVF